ncbi:hypothetical protein QEH52_06705 [Coraliomargarita sp. SDUM461003]|uniref:Uncharacterized protein n=1 Tax=Thalassobacterium maritimum TaxID=3041265 RepID=A0ABU1ASQ2_9BACT|nr:hypothetical protein [Coraliomargarita sp. SDUM461003]MDQ8207190.1 hypothetical protein [Coraliomargarita sp. SDUM461003]
MSTDHTIREISRETLLKSVDRSKRKAVEALFTDRDVDYVVLLESPDRKRRNLLTVGPNLEYPDLTATFGLKIDDLEPSAYVSTQKGTLNKGPRFLSRAAGQIEQLESLISELRKEKKRLHLKLDQALKTVEIVTADRTTLEQLKRQLDQQQIEQASLQNQIDMREADLLKMEEDLLDRMNQLIQKEAELEQWEEDMFARERHLALATKDKGAPELPDTTRALR